MDIREAIKQSAIASIYTKGISWAWMGLASNFIKNDLMTEEIDRSMMDQLKLVAKNKVSKLEMERFINSI